MPDCSSNATVPEAVHLADAVRMLAAGELVVYPTETVYGLGADAFHGDALRRLVALKGREPGKPVSVLIGDPEMLADVAREISVAAVTLMRRFWPGPLTIVFDAHPALSPLLTGDTGTIGVRLSSHPLATALVQALGRPVTTPSANPAGHAPPLDVAQARAYFGVRVGAYLDAGQLPGEPASTVVDARAAVRIVRPGAVRVEAIRSTLADLA